jgi:two-component system NtrC family sensor kinase
LAPRLILALTVVIAAVTTVSSVISVRQQESQLLEQIVRSADQISRSVTRATWEMMLVDRRQAAADIMRKIGEEPDIAWIRVFAKDGRITFSTDPESPRQVDKNAEACFLCHARSEPLVRVDVPSRARIFRGPHGHRKLAMVTPIYNEAACTNGACHAHPTGQRVLGVLDVAFDLDHVDTQIAAVEVRALVTTLLEILLLAFVTAILSRRLVSRPIASLVRHTQQTHVGALDEPIDLETGGELGELARSFSEMRERLKVALDELHGLTRSLEEKVERRGIQLADARLKLIHSDRLASLGQLSASVAHEINNPIAGVLNLAMLLQRLLREDGVAPGRVEEFRGYLAAITEQVTRVGRIVSDLLSFSRRSAPQRSSADLNDLIRDTLTLIEHKLELGNVGLELDLAEDLPPVNCDAAQIQQVVINLVMNGAEATPGGGGVKVATRRSEGSIHIVVCDTGGGIPEEHLAQIFDPFFTTKEAGRGVGLGLSVVHGIVEAHGGAIEVESAVGSGSTFEVTLPVSGVAAEQAAVEEARP